jgi:hypothetical protein
VSCFWFSLPVSNRRELDVLPEVSWSFAICLSFRQYNLFCIFECDLPVWQSDCDMSEIHFFPADWPVVVWIIQKRARDYPKLCHAVTTEFPRIGPAPSHDVFLPVGCDPYLASQLSGRPKVKPVFWYLHGVCTLCHHLQKDRAGLSSGDSLNLHVGDNRFESQKEHQLSWFIFSCFSSVLPGKE